MAQMAIEINGRSYTVGCADGEEERLRGLARYVDSKVRDLARTAGAAGEARLLLLACLTLADELGEAFHEAEEARAGRAGEEVAARALEARNDALQERVTAVESQIARREDALARHLDNFAQRMAVIAERLEAR
ncbi:MAG: cell division protein ZapA [Alphaproteobacteria bacterium]|nr:cell division protein ZapA [Alphaproteobacteria bacterium]